MAEEYRTKLQFNDCPVDEATENLFVKIAKSMSSQPGPYKASFEMEFELDNAVASLTKKTASGLNDEHARMLGDLEQLALKALARGEEGGKVKAEAEVSKEM